MSQREKFTFDLDDVLVDSHESVRLFANDLLGLQLTVEDFSTPGTYWGYYESLWAAEGVDQQSAGEVMARFHQSLVVDQGHLSPKADAVEVVGTIAEYVDIDVITSRPLSLQKATKARVHELFGVAISEVVLLGHPATANMTKGQAVVHLGARGHADDNASHCQSVVDHGREAVLMGEFGWHHDVKDAFPRRRNMCELGSYLVGEQGILHKEAYEHNRTKL